MYLAPMHGVANKNRAHVAALFRALGDETRLQVIELLRSGERCVCELTESLETSQSRLSFHLKVLKESGVIKDRPEGRWVYYALASDAVDELEDMIRVLREGGRSGRGGTRC